MYSLTLSFFWKASLPDLPEKKGGGGNCKRVNRPTHKQKKGCSSGFRDATSGRIASYRPEPGVVSLDIMGDYTSVVFTVFNF